MVAGAATDVGLGRVIASLRPSPTPSAPSCSNPVIAEVVLVQACRCMAVIALVIGFRRSRAGAFRQLRAAGARPFTIVKFRTMRADAQRYSQKSVRADDASDSREGQFLRARHDERTQLCKRGVRR